MKVTLVFLKTFIIFSLFFSLAKASELNLYGLPTRCLAMGGTCISFVRGSQALFLNPAALARMEGFDLMLAQVQAGVSKDAQTFATQIQNNNGSALSLTDVQSLYGKTLTADATARSGIVMPYFGAGVYSTNHLVETFGNPTYPTFNIDYISDYGYTVAGAIPVGPTTSFGIAGRSAKRWGGNKDLNVMSLIGVSNQNFIDQNFPDHGVGAAIDLSFLTTLPGDLKPTFAVVWQDVGSTKYEMYSGTQNPPSQADNLIFGTSIQQDFAMASWTHSFEYQYIRTNSESFGKKVHLGTEASFGFLDLRAGLNQGYLTYGVGVDLWLLKVEAAYYTTELGTYAGQSRSDRYQVGLTIALDFDQAFKLSDMDGKKRRLKQRR